MGERMGEANGKGNHVNVLLILKDHDWLYPMCRIDKPASNRNDCHHVVINQIMTIFNESRNAKWVLFHFDKYYST